MKLKFNHSEVKDDTIRVCDCCGSIMKAGYVDVDNYYCSDRCLIWGNTPNGLSIDPNRLYSIEKWEKDHKENQDYCYYTEWE